MLQISPAWAMNNSRGFTKEALMFITRWKERYEAYESQDASGGT